MRTIGNVILRILKWILKAVITVLWIVLEGLKILLLIFGCILKLILSLVRIATP